MTRTYGHLAWAKGMWLLRAEAHVVLRAKRLFAQVSRKSQGGLLLTDTMHVARDLEWFLQRYPMVVDNVERLTARARECDAAMETVQRVFAASAQPPTFDLALPARRYQARAAELVLATGRLLLGDAVGLGKTATAIAVMSDVRARPAVVVTLTHLPRQWAAEIERFAPQLQVFIPKRGEPTDKDREVLTGLIRPNVVILNYAKLAGWAQTLQETFGAQFVVFDEVQELRTGTSSAKGAAAKALALACKYRMGLSATPVYNYGGEIWNILDILSPGDLGSHGEFQIEWASEFDRAGKEKVKDPKALGSYLRDAGLFLRRTITDVVDEVPALADAIRIPHQIESDTKPIEEAEGAAAALARVILSDTATGIEKMQAGGEIDWRLRQATGIAKASYVAAFVRMLLETEDERVLLFGWHHAVYGLWRESLKAYRPVFFTGDETLVQKEAAKQAFLAGESRVLVMSLRAGAGIDGLQKVCRTVVFGELDWSPGVHEQCIGRIHRPGQENAVRAIFLHSDAGSDPVIVDVLGIKKAQARGITDPDAPLLEQQSSGDHIRRLAERCLSRVVQPAEAV